jgi:hypothetical protein
MRVKEKTALRPTLRATVPRLFDRRCRIKFWSFAALQKVERQILNASKIT